MKLIVSPGTSLRFVPGSLGDAILRFLVQYRTRTKKEPETQRYSAQSPDYAPHKHTKRKTIMPFDYIGSKDFKPFTMLFAKNGHDLYDCYEKYRCPKCKTFNWYEATLNGIHAVPKLPLKMPDFVRTDCSIFRQDYEGKIAPVFQRQSQPGIESKVRQADMVDRLRFGTL